MGKLFVIACWSVGIGYAVYLTCAEPFRAIPSGRAFALRVEPSFTVSAAVAASIPIAKGETL